MSDGKAPPAALASAALAQPAAELLRSLPRHRHRLSREEVRASQAGRIIAATAEVVATEGYASTTVLAIAKRAGVSRKTFYELFEDKEAALLTAYVGVEHLIDRALTATAERATAPATGPELIAAGVEGLLAQLAENPAFTRMFFLEALGAGPRVRARRDQAIEQVTAAIVAAHAAARAAQISDLAPIDHDIARGLVGAGIEMIVRHLVHHEADTLQGIAPAMIKFAERLVPPDD